MYATGQDTYEVNIGQQFKPDSIAEKLLTLPQFEGAIKCFNGEGYLKLILLGRGLTENCMPVKNIGIAISYIPENKTPSDYQGHITSSCKIIGDKVSSINMEEIEKAIIRELRGKNN
jgi:hypothetical protein